MVLIAWDGGPLYGNLKRPIFYTFASVGIAVVRLPSSHMHLCQQYTIYYNMQTKARLVFGQWLLGHIDYVAVVGGGWRTTTLLTSFCQFILFVLAPRVRVRVCTACNFPHTLALNDSY